MVGSGNCHAVLVALFAALGAFLFGLDIGYIASILVAPAFKRDVAHLPDWHEPGSEIDSSTEGFIVAIFSLGCILAASPPVSAHFQDQWGRRPTIALGSIIFLVGCLLQASASSLAQMMVGRFISGLSIGLLSSVVALYQSELAPAAMRGSLTSLYQLMITFGIAVAALLNYFLVHRESGWRAAIFVQALPAAALIAGMSLLPGSPRWLAQKGKVDEARKTLHFLRSDAQEAEEEVKEILAACRVEEAAGQARWADLLGPRVGRLALTGVALQLLAQFVGMNAFMYFGPTVFQSAGFNTDLLQAICCSINFVATFPAIFCSDRLGRVRLLQVGAIAMFLACMAMGITGYLCMARADDGEWHSTSAAGSAVIVAMVLMFIASFAFSWGPVVWVYCAEIFPLKYRSRCMGLATMAMWSGNYCIAQFTPMLLERAGFMTFFIFAAFCFAGFLLASRLPETKGMHLEFIERAFDEKFGVPMTKDDTTDYGATARAVVKLGVQRCNDQPAAC